jgi:hypothetical protein
MKENFVRNSTEYGTIFLGSNCVEMKKYKNFGVQKNNRHDIYFAFNYR